MEEFKYQIERKDDERELFICEGESASTIGKIGIIGQGRKPVTMKEVLEAIDKDVFSRFMDNVESIKEFHRDDMKILMSENTKERIISYAAEVSAEIEEYLPHILTVNGIRDNEIVLGVPSKQDFFDGDVLSQIHLDEEKPFYGEEDSRIHHRGIYTKKRKYGKKKKNKRRRK